MTAKPRAPQTPSDTLFQRNSLKTRVTLSTLAIFLIGIWPLAFYASRLDGIAIADVPDSAGRSGKYLSIIDRS